MLDRSGDTYVPHPNQILPYGTKIRPTNGKVLVRRDPPERVSKTGIVYPGSGKTVDHGTVLAVASFHLTKCNGIRSPMQLKVGDRVLLGKEGGFSVPIYTKSGEVEVLFIVRESDFEHCNEVLAAIDSE